MDKRIFLEPNRYGYKIKMNIFSEEKGFEKEILKDINDILKSLNSRNIMLFLTGDSDKKYVQYAINNYQDGLSGFYHLSNWNLIEDDILNYREIRAVYFENSFNWQLYRDTIAKKKFINYYRRINFQPWILQLEIYEENHEAEIIIQKNQKELVLSLLKCVQKNGYEICTKEQKILNDL